VRPVQQQEFYEHNRYQTGYFERTVKRTMVPVDSAYLRRHVDELLRFADLRPDARVLEVGCGMGRYTLILAERGVRVEGLDLAPALLDRLREYDAGRHTLPLYCADIVDHPQELDGQFDAVIGFFTLHHLHDLPLSFAAMARLLKPGGRIAFLEPNPFNPLYYAQIAFTPGMRWQAERGLARMRRGIVFHAMRDAGLVRPALARFGFFPPFLANRSWGARLESILERAPIWRFALPFQLFRSEQP